MEVRNTDATGGLDLARILGQAMSQRRPLLIKRALDLGKFSFDDLKKLPKEIKVVNKTSIVIIIVVIITIVITYLLLGYSYTFPSMALLYLNIALIHMIISTVCNATDPGEERGGSNSFEQLSTTGGRPARQEP